MGKAVATLSILLVAIGVAGAITVAQLHGAIGELEEAAAERDARQAELSAAVERMTQLMRRVMTINAMRGDEEQEIVADERLYGADEFEILEVIQGLDDAWERVMLFGHNPGLTDLVNALSPTRIDNLPTCGIFELTYDAESWALVGRIDPLAVDFDYPKKGLR